MSSEQFSASPLPPDGVSHCPQCGVRLFTPTDTECWYCDEPLPLRQGMSERTDHDDLFSRKRPPKWQGDPLVFLVLGVVAILICLALALQTPGVAIALLILAAPALIRTLITMHRQQVRGIKLNRTATIMTFLSSVGIVAVVGLTSAIAFSATFFVVCFGGAIVSTPPGDASDSLVVFSIAAGLVPAVVVAGLLLYFLRPRRVR